MADYVSLLVNDLGKEQNLGGVSPIMADSIDIVDGSSQYSQDEGQSLVDSSSKPNGSQIGTSDTKSVDDSLSNPEGLSPISPVEDDSIYSLNVFVPSEHSGTGADKSVVPLAAEPSSSSNQTHVEALYCEPVLLSSSSSSEIISLPFMSMEFDEELLFCRPWATLHDHVPNHCPNPHSMPMVPADEGPSNLSGLDFFEEDFDGVEEGKFFAYPRYRRLPDENPSHDHYTGNYCRKFGRLPPWEFWLRPRRRRHAEIDRMMSIRESKCDGEYGPSGSLLPVQDAGPTGVGAGLSNLGNSCFVNAILQCFIHTVPLVTALRNYNHPVPCEGNSEGFCVLCTFRDQIELSLASSGKIVSPSKLVDNLNNISSCFRRYQQEDAHEFLQCLLDKLERCLDSKPADESLTSQDDNIVKQVFGGRLVSKLRCCNCGHCSDTYEPLIDLSLEIEDVDTLQSALESFTKVEKIEDSETKFTCENCKEHVSIEKQLMVDQAPSVATLHLKRFKTDGQSVEKISKHVQFPSELDLKPYINCSQDSDVDLKYQLYAIVVHNGFFPTSGHYFCYVHSSSDTWHKLDDSMVMKFEEEDVLKEAAYILFYARVGTPWCSSLIELPEDSSDPSVSNTSPKSVLDSVGSQCTSYQTVANISETIEGRDAAEGASTQIDPTMLDGVQINESKDDSGGISAQISHDESTQNGPNLYLDVSMSDTTEADVSAPLEASDRHDQVSHVEKICAQLSVQENGSSRGGCRTERDGGFDPLASPKSEPQGKGSRRLPGSRCRHSWRHHLKVQNKVNYK